MNYRLLIIIFGTLIFIFLLNIIKTSFDYSYNNYEFFQNQDDNSYKKLENVYNDNKDNHDFEEDWNNQTLNGCKNLCDNNSHCIGFYRSNQLKDEQNGQCFPFSNFNCQSEYIAKNRKSSNFARKHNTFIKNIKNDKSLESCFSRHNFNQPVSIRVDTNPYLYWFYDENTATIMIKNNQELNSSIQFPNFQFKFEAGNLPRTLQIHPIKDYNSITQNLSHNYPTETKIIVDNNNKYKLNKSSFIAVSGLNNPNKISFKLIPNGKLEGKDHYLVVVNGYLEISPNVNNRKEMATFEIINPLETETPKTDVYQTKIDSSVEINKLFGEPILTPTERITQTVNQNTNVIKSMEDDILKTDMYLDTLTQYNNQRINNLDRLIDNHLIGDNINNFYKIKKELKKVETTLEQ